MADALSQEPAIDALDILIERFTAELAQRTRAALEQAQAEIDHLQASLREERLRREQAEALLLQREEQCLAIEAELRNERQGRQEAEREVSVIHAAIAAQLEIAEREQLAIEAAEAERQALLESLREELSQERLRRERLQRRVEALRVAAADLFGFDIPAPRPADIDPIPASFPSRAPVVLG